MLGDPNRPGDLSAETREALLDGEIDAGELASIRAAATAATTLRHRPRAVGGLS